MWVSFSWKSYKLSYQFSQGPCGHKLILCAEVSVETMAL